MNSRERILQAVTQNKPDPVALPALNELAQTARSGFDTERVNRYTEVLTSIGGQVVPVTDLAQVAAYIQQQFTANVHRVITTLSALETVAELGWHRQSVHALADVEFAVIGAHFGVVENGAVWLTEQLMGGTSLGGNPLGGNPLGGNPLLHRATPFIAQHLGVVLRADDLVPTMHDAYARIGHDDYGFGVFVAGPSKTADIEQSLVLGAHGPKTMTVFLLS